MTGKCINIIQGDIHPPVAAVKSGQVTSPYCNWLVLFSTEPLPDSQYGFITMCPGTWRSLLNWPALNTVEIRQYKIHSKVI